MFLSGDVPAAMMEPPTSTNMVTSNRACILHVDEGKPPEKKACQDVNVFNEKSWASMLKAAQTRQSKPNFKDSKYFGIVVKLPKVPGETDGFHLKCYQKFTAVKVTPDVSETPTVKLRSVGIRDKNPSSLGIFPAVCLFCGLKRKKKKGVVEVVGACEAFDAAESIQEAARKLGDEELLGKISGVDLIAKAAKYHHSCKSAYVLKAKRISTNTCSKDSSATGGVKETGTAIKNLRAYVENSIIVDKRAELLTSVYERYLDFCSLEDENPMQRFSLMRHLTNVFGVRIKVHVPEGKKLGNIIYNAEIAEDAVRLAYDYSDSDERVITKAALLLRNQLLKAPKKELPMNPTLSDLRTGNVSPPELVTNFIRILYSGSTNLCGKRIERRVQSTSQDMLFVVNRGKAMPAKHVTLGMAIKSVTGSKKLVTVLNRFGYCLNYSALEELETATAEAILARDVACPEETVVGEPMGLAFDNFDEMTHTLSGANTLHDTMGILYQNVSGSEAQKVSPPGRDVMSHKTKENDTVQMPSIQAINKPSKRRTLNVPESPLTPFRGIPKVTVFDYKHRNVFNLTDVGEKARKLDTIWLMNHALQGDNIPMWVGFNANICTDNLPKQEVRYMTNLKEPITSLSVVRNTLIATQKCAQECNQTYGVVTYDLNAAKPAMQIQVMEAPRFNNIFIMLGAFHIEMAFFKAVGKLIAESGGPSMLTETEVLAPGSLKGFISGKHFNRCKRLHPLLALAFEKLHFLAFLEKNEQNNEMQDFLSTMEVQNPEDLSLILSNELFQRCDTAYSEYSDLTRSGAHGATAALWYMYIDYIRLYHQFERSIRTNDIDLFICTLTPMIDLFFATNHINYARWLTKFQLDLLNIEETHPGLREILDQGAFTVRRTNNPFSRNPVDLTLEQTINADAASRLTGITSCTNSYSARLRWMVTKSTRASFVRLLEEMVGLNNSDEATAELMPKRIARDNRDLIKITQQIKDTQNPFLQPTTDNTELLVNISTGKAVSQEIKDVLLNVPETGKTRHKEFIETCASDPDKFESRISKSTFLSFKDGGAKNRKTPDQRIARLVCTRDLLGRLVVLAVKRELDLPHVFQYPLTPVPLSMGNPDETLVKTDKSKLLNLLEGKLSTGKQERPEVIDGFIIDGQFLLRVLPPNLPPTYGGLARSILIHSLSSSARQVHLVFDDYPKPSLKDAERDRRGIVEKEYRITGPEQRRVPKDLSDALKSRSFKRQLPLFLADEWQDPSYGQILGTRHLYMDVPGKCYHFWVSEGVMMREVEESLTSNHQEADTKMIIHAKAADLDCGNTVIRASDTDIAVILIYHSTQLQATLWMDVGTVSKNNRRYINITRIANQLGPRLCSSLPGFHAFTGCDYTSTFFRKGKVRPFELMSKMPDVQNAFAQIARDETTETSRATLQHFTASIYGAKAGTALNKHRYQKFENSYGPKMKGNNPLAKLKGIDASGIPPCESECNMHINRVAFVSKMWANADQLEIMQDPKERDGWQLVDGNYMPIWFEGEQMPAGLVPEEGRDLGEEEDPDNSMEIASSDEEGGESSDDDERS